MVDIPGYVYQLQLAEHWLDGIDTPRYTIIVNKLIKRVSHEQQLGVLRTGNYVQECFRWIFQAMCTNYGWLSTSLMELIHLGTQLYVNKLIKRVSHEQQLGVLRTGNYVQEWFLVDIPGYVYQLRLAEHWFDGIDTPRYTSIRE